MFGLSGGVAGTGIDAPDQAYIQPAATTEQNKAAYDKTLQGMQGQQDLLSALQGQNGLQNQSSIYGQYQGIANGTGPNPALAMLNQATGQNVSNQAALMAGQRGASSNVGLMARQAGMQGANTQQQAAGQAANMQANQSLNALGQMGGIANTQAGQQIAQTNQIAATQQAQHANLMNALSQQNNAQVDMTGGINAANAGMAGTIMKSQEKAIGGLMNGEGAKNVMSGVNGGGGGGGGASGASGMAGMAAMSDENVKKDIKSGDGNVQAFLDAIAAHQYKYKESAGQDNKQHVSPMAQELEQSEMGQQLVEESPKGKMVDYAKAGPAILSSLAQINKRLNTIEGNKSGSDEREKFAEGGQVGGQANGPQSYIGQYLAGMSRGGQVGSGHGVEVMVSPGEKIAYPNEVKKMSQGGNPQMKTVPGKAEVKGDSLKNDKVSAKLPAGSVVVKRSRANNNPEGFIREVLSKRGKK